MNVQSLRPASIALLYLVACTPAAEEDAAGRGSGAPSESAADAPRVESDLLVSSDWLAERLDAPALVVVHVAPDRADYDEGHVPGARFLPLSSIAADRDGNLNELPPVAHLDSVFDSLGISDDGRIVVYGPPLAAARAFFTLDFLGHGDRTALLDGGLEGWRAEGRPLSTEAPRFARADFTPRPQPERVVDAEWVSSRLDTAGMALVDARPQAQFTGAEGGPRVPRPGHIPGAGNVFWEEMIESTERPSLKDPEALRAMFEDAGVDPDDRVVTYCLTGMQSSFAYFVARYLGYETHLYDGSFMDWSRRAELPVERRGDGE